MSITTTSIVLAACLVGTVLGGIYLAFDLAVIPALANTAVHDPSAAAATMREINVVIVRPLFLAILFGAPLFAVVAAITAPSPWTIAAAALQVAGIVITVAVNVPANNALAADLTAQAWSQFAATWIPAHHVRGGAALLGGVLLAVRVVA